MVVSFCWNYCFFSLNDWYIYDDVLQKYCWGYEDRKNYRIMRQVGLEEERIKSVINDQVVIILLYLL